MILTRFLHVCKYFVNVLFIWFKRAGIYTCPGGGVRPDYRLLQKISMVPKKVKKSFVSPKTRGKNFDDLLKFHKKFVAQK